MNVSFKKSGKNFSMNVQEVKGIKKFTGLMFRTNSPPLLFNFRKPTNLQIHSLFCKKFLGVWILGGNMIKIQVVKPFRLGINPKKSFDKLIEIPFTEKNKRILGFLVGD